VRKFVTLVLFIAVAGALSGCATIFKGSTQDINFSSQPDGAQVFIDGVSYGTTPTSVQLKTDKSYTVTMRYQGQERTVILNNEIGTLWIVLDVISGLVPVIIDASTGAWYELEPDQVVVNFN
jgi:uncharacterized protein YceK